MKCQNYDQYEYISQRYKKTDTFDEHDHLMTKKPEKTLDGGQYTGCVVGQFNTNV